MLISIKKKLRKNALLFNLYQDFLYLKYKRLFDKDPKLAADKLYYTAFKKHINWETPKDLNEKIHWMLHNTDTSLWTKCADKYQVRDFVKERGCGQYLVDLYGRWENPNEIDFSLLPNQFVLKANNGSGTVMVVKEKDTLNERKIRKTLHRWLKRPYGYMGGQLHYLKIPRCIIAEEFLEEKGEQKALSPSALIDYKIWCINGMPECILVIFGREGKSYFRQVYDLNWNKMNDVMNMHTNGHFDYKNIEIPKPKCLDEMVEMAKKLSAPFKEVRVDLYVIEQKPYFGELTFTAGMGSFTEKYYNYLGDKIDLKAYD